jgi:hypothetical protein
VTDVDVLVALPCAGVPTDEMVRGRQLALLSLTLGSKVTARFSFVVTESGFATGGAGV